MIALAAAAVAAPAVGGRSFAAGEGEYDVVVIGAGAAGLAAGRVLQEAGKRFTIIEARDRVGGRARTDRSLGVPFDAGAAFVHFVERNPWAELAEEHGMELLPWKGWSHFRPYVGGTALGDGYLERRRRARETLWSLIEVLDRRGEDASLASVAASMGEDGITSIRDLAMLSLGENPERVSALDAGSLWEGSDRVVPGGYGTLVAKEASGLPIRLDCPASGVVLKPRHVEIVTPLGTIKAGHVVVTVPLGVLAAEKIRFAPGLPVETIRAIEGLSMGALTKVVLRFDGERFGILPGDDFVVIDFGAGPMTFEMWPFDRDIVIGVTGGDAGRDLGARGEAEAVAAALDAFGSVVGGAARERFVGGRLAEWWHDPAAHGSYSIVRPGHGGVRAALGKPVAGRVWFAGEATAGGGAMTVGGATLEGRRVAKAILSGTQ